MTDTPAPQELMDAIAAGDGTLHGAIDYWHERALMAEAERNAAVNALRTQTDALMAFVEPLRGLIDALGAKDST